MKKIVKNFRIDGIFFDRSRLYQDLITHVEFHHDTYVLRSSGSGDTGHMILTVTTGYDFVIRILILPGYSSVCIYIIGLH